MPQWQCRGCRKWTITAVKPDLMDRTCAFCQWRYDPDAPYVGPPPLQELKPKPSPTKQHKRSAPKPANGRRHKRATHRKAKR